MVLLIAMVKRKVDINVELDVKTKLTVVVEMTKEV